MANYGIKYQCVFDPVIDSIPTDPTYTLQILEKDYVGDVIDVVGGGVPVLHYYQTDEPKAAIKGSSLSITLINDGSLPLESFFSVDDDQFQVKLSWTTGSATTVMFIGFLVQDDCG